MPTVPIFQLDSFTDRAFHGNPAAVCVMEQFEADDLLQSIALENNLSETAFVVPSGDDQADYDLRWFTPAVEVDLCGHATLAAGQVVLTYLHPDWDSVRFKTASGIFELQRDGDRLVFDFPKLEAIRITTPPASLLSAFGQIVEEVWQKDRDYLLVFKSAEDIADLKPDMVTLRQNAPFGFVCTAPGTGVTGEPDFVSRCFYPNHGIEEDPVTGSAHSLSAPYWAQRLNKTDLFAKQISARGGDLWITVEDANITLSGSAVEVLKGEFMYG